MSALTATSSTCCKSSASLIRAANVMATCGLATVACAVLLVTSYVEPGLPAVALTVVVTGLFGNVIPRPGRWSRPRSAGERALQLGFYEHTAWAHRPSPELQAAA